MDFDWPINSSNKVGHLLLKLPQNHGVELAVSNFI